MLDFQHTILYDPFNGSKPITVVVVAVFFLVLFLLWIAVDKWITGGLPATDYSSRMAVWEDRAGGGEVCLLGISKPVRKVFPASGPTWTPKDRTLSWAAPRMCKGGQVATNSEKGFYHE